MTPVRKHLRDRGATLVEYALIVALLCIVIIGAAQAFEDGAEDRYGERASQGSPSEEFGNLGPTDGGADGGVTDGTDGEEEDPGVTNIVVEALTASAPKNGGDWSMTVTVTVLGDGQPLGGVVFSPSSWSPAIAGSTTSCTTTATGVCTFTQSPMKISGTGSTPSVTFTLGSPSFTNPSDPQPAIVVTSTAITCNAPQGNDPGVCA